MYILRSSRSRASVAALSMLTICGGALALPINGRVPVHTFTVGPMGTAAPDATINQDFQFANLIYNQVGIRFDNTGDTFVQANTPATPGQWTDAFFTSTLNTAARQQGTGFAYYVLPGQSYENGTTTLAETWSQEDAGNMIGPATINVRTIAARGTRGGTETVAHEFGHMLSNRYRWRRFESASATNLVHSGTVTDLMTPNVRNSTVAQLWPQGTESQIRHNIGRYNGASAGRIPLINSLYDDGNSGGAPGGSAMFSQVNRDPFQYSMNQNNSTLVASPNWGETSTITLPTAIGPGTHTYTVNETARRGPGMTETFSFFITSTDGWSIGHDLGMGWHFSAFGINSLDGDYTGFIANSLEVRIWTDILASTAITDANGGAGLLVDPARYTASSGLSGGGLMLDLHFTAADAFTTLAGYRDMQITFSANWIPAPGAAALLGIAGIVTARRRRRA